MSSYILAIHAGHNACALLGDESGVVYAIQEERLTGEKNYWGFPEKSIEECLRIRRLQPTDIDSVVVGMQQIISRRHSRDDVLKSYSQQDTFAGKIRQRLIVPFVLNNKLDYGQDNFLKRLSAIGFKKDKVSFYDHHLSHAATAYFGLRQNQTDEYLVVTCDGMGDNVSATIRVMGPQKNELIATTHSDNSLGALYSWVTFRMGFVPLEHEYKLMGMAPYAASGYSTEVRDILYEFLDLDQTGLSFKRKTIKRTNDVSRDLFRMLDGKRFDSICGGLQMFTEEILTRWVTAAIKKTGVQKVLAAGGVFMNVKANKCIGEIPDLRYFEAFPSCGDETLIFGAYFQKAAEKFGHASVKRMENFYTGDDLDESEIASVLKKYEYNAHRMSDPAAEVATVLAKGFPVARCAGSMEFGARALGNRSILADPSNQDIVRVINQMVKKRDFWMPFAPMMIKDKSERYIRNDKGLDSPFMMMTFDTRENFMDLISAVHQGDLTCRAQLLTRSQNAPMFDILEQFEKRTNKAVILNTSFNLHGFPIARNAADAMYIFDNSGLEYMQLGNYLISKK